LVARQQITLVAVVHGLLDLLLTLPVLGALAVLVGLPLVLRHGLLQLPTLRAGLRRRSGGVTVADDAALDLHVTTLRRRTSLRRRVALRTLRLGRRSVGRVSRGGVRRDGGLDRGGLVRFLPGEFHVSQATRPHETNGNTGGGPCVVNV